MTKARKYGALAALTLAPLASSFSPAGPVLLRWRPAPVVVAAVRLQSSKDAFAAELQKAPAGLGGASTVVADPAAVTNVWELDVYSRPVTVGGKKLWELLITDSSGSFKHVEPIPSNKVNSREVRARVEAVIEAQHTPTRPKEIRFFRRAMVNMLSIALKDIATGVAVRPTRTAYALTAWLEQREQEVYPAMIGFDPSLGEAGAGFLDVSTPGRLPDVMRAEQFAFVTLPLSEVLPGGGVDATNVGVGTMCPVPRELSPDAMLPGVLFITSRAASVAQWLAGSDLAHIKADLKRRELVMEVGLSTRYLTAKLTDNELIEAKAFEAGKARLKGLHFVGVQTSTEDDDVKGFWLRREMGL